MMIFEMHNAIKYCLGSGVAPQTLIPLYPTGQQKCSWIPRMMVFEMHNAIKWCLDSGVAPQTPIPLYPSVQQKCFWVPRIGCLKCTMPKKFAWVLVLGDLRLFNMKKFAATTTSKILEIWGYFHCHPMSLPIEVRLNGLFGDRLEAFPTNTIILWDIIGARHRDL